MVFATVEPSYLLLATINSIVPCGLCAPGRRGMIHLELTNAVDRYPRPDFIIDVKVCAMVTADGDWKARWNADKTVLENHTLAKAEDEKFSKHESSYAAVSYAFSPFVLGCFGGIGSQAARFLCALTFLELRQHDAILERAGLAPLSPSDSAQFRARCFRQASTRISAALAKATVMRLTGPITRVLRHSLPLPTFLIASVLPIAQALLSFFHDAVNFFLPLPSLHPPMPPLFPLFLSFPTFSVDFYCAS